MSGGVRHFLQKFNFIRDSFPNDEVTVHRDIKYHVKAGDKVITYWNTYDFDKASPQEIVEKLKS